MKISKCDRALLSIRLQSTQEEDPNNAEFLRRLQLEPLDHVYRQGEDKDIDNHVRDLKAKDNPLGIDAGRLPLDQKLISPKCSDWIALEYNNEHGDNGPNDAGREQDPSQADEASDREYMAVETQDRELHERDTQDKEHLLDVQVLPADVRTPLASVSVK